MLTVWWNTTSRTALPIDHSAMSSTCSCLLDAKSPLSLSEMSASFNLHRSPFAFLDLYQKSLTLEIDFLLTQETPFRSGHIPGLPRSQRSLFVVTGRGCGAIPTAAVVVVNSRIACDLVEPLRVFSTSTLKNEMLGSFSIPSTERFLTSPPFVLGRIHFSFWIDP